MYKKPFYIAVEPIASKFARGLQFILRKLVHNRIYRASPRRVKPGRSQFTVTQQPLNKVQQFYAFTKNNISCPKFCTNPAGIAAMGSKTVFARTLINATNGRGIVEFDATTLQPPRAPLYTEYIPKKSEYRFHVFGGKVIDIQQKKKKRGFDDERDTRIRNLHNGYVYCRDGAAPPDGAADLAIRATRALGYLYGAVDVIYNEKRNECFVLEVNSRPGLMGTTLDKYGAAIVKTYDLWSKL
jgi:hypothetical protein